MTGSRYNNAVAVLSRYKDIHNAACRSNLKLLLCETLPISLFVQASCRTGSGKYSAFRVQVCMNPSEALEVNAGQPAGHEAHSRNNRALV